MTNSTSAHQKTHETLLRFLANLSLLTYLYLLSSPFLMSSDLLIQKAEDKEVVFILSSGSRMINPIIKGIRDELDDDFELYFFTVQKNYSLNDFTSQVENQHPKIFILIDNLAISLILEYQSTQSLPMIPSISLMSINADLAINHLQNAVAISYEVPLSTSLVHLRRIMTNPLKKVGIIHRSYLNLFLRENKPYCRAEGFEIIDIELPDSGTGMANELKRGLKRLLKKDQVDALWIPNDPSILTPSFLRSIWIHQISRAHIPVLVGVENLANPDLNFGTIAILPDNIELGAQAADLVYEAKSNNWSWTPRKFPPLSIYKVLNYRQANKCLKIKESELNHFDKLLK